MKKKLNVKCTFVLFFLLVSIFLTADVQKRNPIAVSPGNDSEASIVWQSCPTFSWSEVSQAASYRVVVFETQSTTASAYEDTALQTQPVINYDIQGPALSWTIPADKSLKPGTTYTWFVQAIDSNGNPLNGWSNGRIFKVEQDIRFIQDEKKLTEVLKENGVDDSTISNILKNLKTQSKQSTGTDTSGSLAYEGDSNTFYGIGAGDISTPGTYNSFFGYSIAINNSGNKNSFFGALAGNNNTTGSHNTALGFSAGSAISTGNYNTSIGCETGPGTGNASFNTYLGNLSGSESVVGNNNTLIGNKSGVQNSGNFNVSIGDSAGYFSTGSNNSFLGSWAGYNNYQGYSNTFVGNEAGYNNRAGYENVYIGRDTGDHNSSGHGNIFLGFNAGYNETGSNKLYIHNSNTTTPLIYGEFDTRILNINGKLGVGTSAPTYQLEVSTTGTGSNIVATRTDGASFQVSAAGGYGYTGTRTDHPVRFTVNSIWKMQLNGSGHYIDMADGGYYNGTWTNASSRKLKENIADLSTDDAMNTLCGLNPVTFNYKTDKEEKLVGFIAEDVPELVSTKDHNSISSMDIVAVLTKVVQEQQKVISDLQERIQKLENKE